MIIMQEQNSLCIGGRESDKLFLYPLVLVLGTSVWATLA